MIKFMLGMFVGSAVGFFTAALLAVNEKGDRYEF